MPNPQQPGPRAELDPRYSDPTATATDWDTAVRRLAGAEVAWIVTVRPDGRPHATPMVPVLLSEVLYFHTGPTEVKYANLQADPRVLVLAGDTAWEAGLDVVLEGVAAPVTDPALLEEVAALYRSRWDGHWRLTVRDGAFVNAGEGGAESRLFAVRPNRVYAYAKGEPFGHTRYWF